MRSAVTASSGLGALGWRLSPWRTTQGLLASGAQSGVYLLDRLGNVGFVTRNVTAEEQGPGNENPAMTEVEAGEEIPE